jgi:hypothetical protein
MTHFWQGGGSAYAAALAKQRDRQIDELEKQLNSANSAAQLAALKERIGQVRQDFRRRIARVGHSLF